MFSSIHGFVDCLDQWIQGCLCSVMLPGVCYNTSAANDTHEYVYGLWNDTLAKENNITAVLATEEYLK